MRKLFVLALCLFCLGSAVFAAENYQKIYSIDDPIFARIQKLYVLNGLALPSSTGPWSGSEIMDMLSRLDVSCMSETEKAC